MDRKFQLKQALAFMARCCFFNIVVIVCFIHVAEAETSAAPDGRVPAMYVFGDSLADVGNNNYLPGSRAVVNFRPYGVDYPGGVPTGRFSNGYIFVDYLAMKMGFRESPPPALAVVHGDGKLPSAKEFKGLNFASGGAGILDSTGANDSISLSTQIDLFAKVGAWLVDTRGKQAAEADLSRSPFIFSAGVNDLAVLLPEVFSSLTNSSSNNSSVLPPDVFVSRLVAAYRGQLRRIYDLGARKFVFINAAKAGCVPGARAMSASGSCLDRFNAIMQMFNEAVEDMLLQGLATGDPNNETFSAKDFKYSITNTYDLLDTLIANPRSFGLTEVRKACCGLGTFDAAGSCQPNTTNFCSDRAQHLFWDVSHPSQATAKLIADYGFCGSPKFAYPVNIAQLMHLDC